MTFLAPSADGGIKRFHVEVSAFVGQPVFVEALRRPLAVDRLSQQGDLAALLNGKGHPVLDFGIETGFQFQINGHMQQRGARTDEQPVAPELQCCVP